MDERQHWVWIQQHRADGAKILVHTLLDSEGRLDLALWRKTYRGLPGRYHQASYAHWACFFASPSAQGGPLASPDSVVTWCDSRYPANLRVLDDPPAALFFEGDLPALNQPQIAVVGSRQASPYSRRWAAVFCRHLMQHLTITSGMAYGIDAVCHQTCVQAQRPTVAVLGCGLDQPYPRRHHHLRQGIISGGGVLISEYPSGVGPKAHHFPYRNRIISGLSLGVLVVQAAEKSGSLATAYHALDQGKSIFVLPGSIDDDAHRGGHRLIKEGAFLVDHPEEIFEHLGLTVSALPIPLSGDAKKLLMLMSIHTPSSYEALLDQTELTAQQLSSMLSWLESNGHVYQSINGYIRTS